MKPYFLIATSLGALVGCVIYDQTMIKPAAMVAAAIVTYAGTFWLTKLAIKRLRRKPEVTSVPDDTAILQGICPDCGARDLYLGPQGGMSQNVVCDSCDMEFNVIMLPGGPSVHERMGKCGAQRKASAYGIRP